MNTILPPSNTGAGLPMQALVYLLTTTKKA